jgi:hypothetical protein
MGAAGFLHPLARGPLPASGVSQPLCPIVLCRRRRGLRSYCQHTAKARAPAGREIERSRGEKREGGPSLEVRRSATGAPPASPIGYDGKLGEAELRTGAWGGGPPLQSQDLTAEARVRRWTMRPPPLIRAGEVTASALRLRAASSMPSAHDLRRRPPRSAG